MPSNTGEKPTYLTLSAATHAALKEEAAITDNTMSNIADRAIESYLTSKLQPQQSNPICTFFSRIFSYA